jgi:hypothetical protein
MDVTYRPNEEEEEKVTNNNEDSSVHDDFKREIKL